MTGQSSDIMTVMITVIIAGGSGTRLWPLSTPEYPKHLLRLANEDSLIQNTLVRARKLTTDDKIFVITDASHEHHVVEQLDDLKRDHILSEPARRGTASCVLLAMQHIRSVGLDENEPVVFLWADHLIRDQKGFVTSFKWAARLAKKHQKVVFIGAEPTYPSTGFGYMEHGNKFDDEEGAYVLSSFHEKPDAATARKYLASGKFFWNMGYLVTSLAVFEQVTSEYSPEYFQGYQNLCTAKDVKAAYLDLQNIAVDYVFSEKIKGALVIPGSFDWVDIGSFKDLHEISPQDDCGNHVKGKNVELENATNCFVDNETEVPIAVIGLDNVVVVNTPNGVLVTNKNYAQKVGDVAKRLQA